MDLETLLRTKLHVHQGGTLTWAIHEDVAKFLFDAVCPDHHTLETGIGLSTVIFAMRGSKHITVAPSAEEVERVKVFCGENGISTDRIEFVVDFSDAVLPKMMLPELDLVLIDGGHGFPVPYIDWRYTAPRLRVGGRVIVDDCQLETGAVLRDFLRLEPAWTEEKDFWGRTSAFRLTTAFRLSEWDGQPYIVTRSRRRQAASNLRRAVDLLLHGRLYKLARAARRWWSRTR